MAVSTRTQTEIALGAALKSARESRGLTQRALAERIGRSSDSGIVSRWESSGRTSGGRTPKPEDVAQIIEALDITGEEAAELMALATGAGRRQWLAVTLPERRQQLNALLVAESKAKKVEQVAPLLIPGVCQTSDVMRAIMVDDEVPEDEIPERVAVRIGRRELITRKNPAELTVILGEAAIRHEIGSPQIMADQLRYLIELGELPNVDLRVVRYSAGMNSGLGGAFILLDSDEAPSIVSIDLQRSGLMLTDSQDIAFHRRVAEKARGKAMKPEETAGFIAEVATEMEKQT